MSIMHILAGMGFAILCVAVTMLIGLIGGYLEYRLKYKPLFDDLEKRIQKVKSNKLTDKNINEIS